MVWETVPSINHPVSEIKFTQVILCSTFVMPQNMYISNMHAVELCRLRSKSKSWERRYFLGATRSIEPSSYSNVSGWLGAVCHTRYCIKTTKPILKLFRPSGSPIIEAFGTPCADTKFQGEPLHRGV